MKLLPTKVSIKNPSPVLQKLTRPKKQQATEAEKIEN